MFVPSSISQKSSGGRKVTVEDVDEDEDEDEDEEEEEDEDEEEDEGDSSVKNEQSTQR